MRIRCNDPQSHAEYQSFSSSRPTPLMSSLCTTRSTPHVQSRRRVALRPILRATTAVQAHVDGHLSGGGTTTPGANNSATLDHFPAELDRRSRCGWPRSICGTPNPMKALVYTFSKISRDSERICLWPYQWCAASRQDDGPGCFGRLRLALQDARSVREDNY
jgi:hypothetical protein